MSVPAAQALLRAGSATTTLVQRHAGWIALALSALALWWLLGPYRRVLFGLVPADAAFTAGGGDVTAAFYRQRKHTAARLREVLRGNALTGSGRCEALYDALGWNDNQLRLIHNTYKNAYGQTLHSALGETYTDDCSFLGTSDGLNNDLMQKLNNLALT